MPGQRQLGGAFLGRYVTRMSAGRGYQRVMLPDGRVLVCDCSDMRYPWVIAEACGEGGVGAVVRELLHRGDTFVDIGANGGGVTAYAASIVGPSGAVFAFEPQPRLARAVEHTRRLNRTPGEVHQVAASDSEGTLSLSIPPRQSGSASLHTKGFPTVTVSAVRLDSLLPTDTRRNMVIKIDVEGHELAALRGAARTISSSRPKIILEYNPTIRGAPAPHMTLNWLADLGYRFAEVDELALTRPAIAVADGPQRDLVAMPA
jgi:FkbM family methyltransferase